MNCRLWAITSFFNPCNYQNRRSNYDIFRQRLQVPLVTVELSFTGKFQLTDQDADILIQIHGKDVMWQKERLLNVAIESLPDDCDQVAWVDCDIVFENENWPRDAEAALENYWVIQPFEYSYEVNRSAPTDRFSPERSHHKCESLAKTMEHTAMTRELMHSTDKRTLGFTPGLAWAARRDLLDRHKLYDACIVGGGDGPILSGVLGNFQDISDYLMMNPRRQQHYLAWVKPFYEEVAGSFAYIPGSIYHLWHGAIKDRDYAGRRAELENHAFDPYRDIAVSSNGCWQWSSDKPGLHRYLKDYFARRFEDG